MSEPARQLPPSPPLLIQIPQLECYQCGHTWVPRKAEVRRCPKCGSVQWDKPKKQ